jgi:hypothetical protein
MDLKLNAMIAKLPENKINLDCRHLMTAVFFDFKMLN